VSVRNDENNFVNKQQSSLVKSDLETTVPYSVARFIKYINFI